MVDKVDKIWFDGKLIPWEQANVHVLTHTLHYGLGVFEGIRCYKLGDGRSAIFRLEEHIRRLFDSAHICMLPMPFSQAEIVEGCLETVRANGLDECYLRPIAFMGAFFLTVANQLLQLAGTWRPLMIGVLICSLIMFLPGGFMQIVDWIDQKRKPPRGVLPKAG